jgi:hypothetical protein
MMRKGRYALRIKRKYRSCPGFPRNNCIAIKRSYLYTSEYLLHPRKAGGEAEL